MLILALFASFPSFSLCSKPLSKLAGPPPAPVHSQNLLSASPFLPPQMLSQPFALLPLPCRCPSAPAASQAHGLTHLCPKTTRQHLWAQVVLGEKLPGGT